MQRDHRAEFERFARAEMAGLLRYAVALTGDGELARDLVQDVLVKAYEAWPRIGTREYPRAYVRTMITNLFLSWRRRWSVRNICASDDLRPPAIDDFAPGLAERDSVHRRLAALPRQQRAVLVLRYYERLTDAEIANVLGCAVGTVRSSASRALATLRKPDETEPDPDVDRPVRRRPLLLTPDATPRGLS